MKYILTVRHNNTADKEFITDLKRTAGLLGKKSFSQTEYRAHGKFHPATISRRFGGWNAALIKAGLKIKKYHRISEDDLIQNMKTVWDSLKRQPSVTEMQKPLSEYSASVYTGRWGSWVNALKAFVEAMNGSKGKGGKIKPKRSIQQRKTSRVIASGLRFEILKRDNYKCMLCGRSPAVNPKVKLHVDHIKPWSKGGETVRGNLQTLCEDCNLGKGGEG